MAQTSYRAAIIGLGFIGGADQVSGDALGQRVVDLDGTHLDAFSGHPRVELVAGSSRDAGRRERFAARTTAQTYDDWRQMLNREQPDLVGIATYSPHHAGMTQACAAAGVRAVLCEKPIATRLADAERMIVDCRETGTLLVVNHNRRFNPNYRRLRALVAEGHLGTLTSAALQWGTGRLGNVGTHMIDALRMVTGREVAAVSATLDPAGRPDCRGPEFRDPGGWGLLKFEDGLIATLDAADYASVPARIELNGTRGRAVTGGREVTLEFWDGVRQQWAAPEDGSSMDRAVAEMVAWLDDPQAAPFPYAAEEAVLTLECIVALHASHGQQARWTSLPLYGADRGIEVRSG